MRAEADIGANGSRPAVLLIVNADDLGFEPARDRAIVELFTAGAITSASLAVNGPSAETAAALARDAGLPLGLHLNLGDGPALTGTSPLTADTGLLPGKAETRRNFDAAMATGGQALESLRHALRAEIRAQVERFFALVGRWPTHVDGHHHIHVHPLVAGQLAAILSREHGVHRVRLPTSDEDLDAAFGNDPGLLAFHHRVQSESAQAGVVFRQHGLRSPDAFFGIGLMGARMQPARLAAALATARNAVMSRMGVLPAALPVIELMCHPGHASAGGTGFGASPDRQREFDTLLGMFGGNAWPDGFNRASYSGLVRPPCAAAPVRTLIYGKLSPASGNRTTADRLGEHLASLGEVLYRPLPPGGPRETEVASLRDMVDEEGIDLAIGIHCGRAGKALQMAFAAPQTSPAPPLPYILVASGTDLNVDLAGNSGPDRRTDVLDAVASAAGVVALSDELAARLQDALPHARTTPVTTMHQAPAIDTESTWSLRAALGLPPGLSLALLPAGIRPVKGIALAIEAGAQALLDHPDWAIVIAGPPLDPDYHAHCASLVREWSLRHRALKGRLLLTGALERPDYLAALREASLLLNTSESEGMSNAVLEALGAGVPVLVRDIPGNRAAIGADPEACGLAFTGLPDFVRQFGRLATDAALRQRLAEAGRNRYASLCDPAAERWALSGLVAQVLARRLPKIDLPSGESVRLCLADHTHAPSEENLRLFAQAPVTALPKHPLRVLDMGCGSGVFGWVMSDRIAQSGRLMARVDFADNEPDTIAGLRHALRRSQAWWAARADRVECFAGDLFAALTAGCRGGYDLILANLPQTPSPQPIANDRHGGADLLERFLTELPGWLAPGGCAFCTHIGLADPGRVGRAMARAGLVSEVVAEQSRQVPAAHYDDLLPGLADFLVAEAKAGRCEMACEASAEGLYFRFPDRLLCIRRPGE